MATEAQSATSTQRTKIDSFILKVSRRDDADVGARSHWHGQITHVPSGESVYSNDPNELLTKTAMQLQKLGVPFAICWRVKFWLHDCKQRWSRERE